MTESDKDQNGGAEVKKEPRTQQEIMNDLFTLMEKAAKKEIGSENLLEGQYKAAKELFDIGKVGESFVLLTSTMQLEAARTNSRAVESMGEVADHIRSTENGFNDDIGEFGKSVGVFGDHAEVVQRAGSVMGVAAENMMISSSKMDTGADTIGMAVTRIGGAAEMINEASYRIGNH